MNIQKTILNNLNELINVIHIDIKDSTGKHVHHDNFDGGHHLSAIIVSDDFISKTLIERHQIVYKALGSMINNEIHAFSMKTYTEDEWESHVA